MKHYFLATILAIGLTGCNRVMESDYFTPNQNPAPTPAPVAGPQGPAGATGAQGPAGAKGATGAAGSNGTNGKDGTNGANGTNGTNGTNGKDGNGYTPGLSCDVYSIKQADENGTVNWINMFTDGTIKFTTTIANFDVANQSNTNIFGSFTAAQQALIGYSDYAIDCHGFLNAPVSGYYNFNLGSDDGSELLLDNAPVINIPNLQPYANASATALVYSGLHKINVFYFQGPPVMIGLTLKWQGPSNAGLGTLSTIPASYFTH